MNSVIPTPLRVDAGREESLVVTPSDWVVSAKDFVEEASLLAGKHLLLQIPEKTVLLLSTCSSGGAGGSEVLKDCGVKSCCEHLMLCIVYIDKALFLQCVSSLSQLKICISKCW